MTSFSSFFDGRKCESCNEGRMVRGGDVDEEVMDCPDPCPRESDNEYVAEQFNEWLDNVETKLSKDDYIMMCAEMDGKELRDGYTPWIEFDVTKYSDIAEAFWNWVEANKSIFTAEDYFEMGGAV